MLFNKIIIIITTTSYGYESKSSGWCIRKEHSTNNVANTAKFASLFYFFSFEAGPTTSLTASTSVAPIPVVYSFVPTPSVPNNCRFEQVQRRL